MRSLWDKAWPMLLAVGITSITAVPALWIILHRAS